MADGIDAEPETRPSQRRSHRQMLRNVSQKADAMRCDCPVAWRARGRGGQGGEREGGKFVGFSPERRRPTPAERSGLGLPARLTGAARRAATNGRALIARSCGGTAGASVPIRSCTGSNQPTRAKEWQATWHVSSRQFHPGGRSPLLRTSTTGTHSTQWSRRMLSSCLQRPGSPWSGALPLSLCR